MRTLRFSAALIVLSVATPCFASFTDVPSTHANAEAIGWAQTEGVIDGYSDGSFRPEQTVNRAEFVKILIGAALGYKGKLGGDDTGIRGFSDVDVDAWYAPFLRVALQERIIAGYSDKTFRPARTINVAEASKIVVEAFGIRAIQHPSIWYAGYIKALAERGSIPTSIGGVGDNVTRGELAEMVYRIKNIIETRPSRSYRDLVADSSPALSSSASSVSSESSASFPITYTDFTPNVIGNGQTSMLFFYASWHLPSQSNDNRLEDWYEADTMIMPTYRVWYDDEATLRSRYKVLHQNTFIVIDGGGDVLWFRDAPAESAVKQILSGNVQLEQ